MFGHSFKAQAWLAGAALAAAGAVHADTLVLDFTDPYSGTAPGGAAPWIVATFTEVNAHDVQLVISTPGLTMHGGTNENLVEIDFNTALDSILPGLTFTYDSGPSALSVSASSDAFKADGDGFYDIQFMFTPGNTGFNGNMTAVYDITDSSSGPALSAASFFALSKPAGGTGPFYAAAHVQSTGSNGASSGWVSAPTGSLVPLPASVWLLLSGILCVGALARRAAVLPLG